MKEYLEDKESVREKLEDAQNKDGSKNRKKKRKRKMKECLEDEESVRERLEDAQKEGKMTE